MFLRVVIAIFVLVSALLTTMATPVANASVAPTEPSHVAVAWNPCAGKALITVSAVVTNVAGPIWSGPYKGMYRTVKTIMKVGNRIRVRGCISSEREFIVS